MTMRSRTVPAIILLVLVSWGIPSTAQEQPANPPASQQPQAGPAAAEQNQVPAPFTLTPEEQQRLDQLLTYWERRSSAVKTYSCSFQRFEYDMVFGPKDPNIAKTHAEGIIRYSAPDKGEFNVTRLGKNPDFKMESVDHVEHWICDGSSVFELNPQKQQLIEQKLPPSMKGTQIADGPLPFMFGAKKEKLLSRYWIREIKPPENRPNEYWIEAFPRTREDAANFVMVRVILDQKTFLPNALQIFPPNYHPKDNPSRTSYVFSSRKINDPIHRGQEFLGRFISPKPPRGWKKVVESFESVPVGNESPQMANRGRENQARRDPRAQVPNR